MSHRLLPDRTWIMLSGIVCLALSLSGVSGGEVIPHGSDVGTVRFDAILELNAPGAHTHVVLFVRYWVGPDHYTAGIVWVEPHTGGLNYACYPVSLVIHSDANAFALSHQLHSSVNSTFAKPIGRRSVFSHRFNSYDIDEIRFAESDALAARIYASDLKSFDPDHAFQCEVKTAERQTEQGIRRDVAYVTVSTVDGRAETLNVSRQDGRPLKSVRYEYAMANGEWLLSSEKVELPPTPITASIGANPVIVDLPDTKAMVREFPILHHPEGRTATIDFEVTRLNERKVNAPRRIVVRRDTDGTVLRTARLSNFICSRQDALQCKEEAERFARLSDPEEQCRQSLIKHWLHDPGDLSPADANNLSLLRATLESRDRREMVIGEQLRHLNQLLELDWIMGDVNLSPLSIPKLEIS